MAEALRVLSAGAPQTGVAGCIEAFMASRDVRIAADFATAPQIRAVLDGDGSGHPDIVIAPVGLIETLLADGRAVVGAVARIGDVAAGVVVRAGAPHPDISSEDALRRAILAADRVIYNEASSGAYIGEMVGRLGIADAVEAKTERLPSAGDVMTRLAAGRGTEIGFGQVPAIRRLAGAGVELVGALPGALGHRTSYAAALTAASRHAPAARQLLDYLASPAARAILAAAGVV